MTKTNNQFTITLPQAWDDQSTYTFVGPELNGMRHIVNLIVDNEIGNNDLLNFALERVSLIKSTLPSVETLKEEERTLPNGLPIYEWIYKWVPVDGQIQYKKLVYLILDGKGYTFSALFSKQSYKLIGLEVDQMIASFTPASIQRSGKK